MSQLQTWKNKMKDFFFFFFSEAPNESDLCVEWGEGIRWAATHSLPFVSSRLVFPVPLLSLRFFFPVCFLACGLPVPLSSLSSDGPSQEGRNYLRLGLQCQDLLFPFSSSFFASSTASAAMLIDRQIPLTPVYPRTIFAFWVLCPLGGELWDC